jgi:hypothetical protein
MGLKHLGRVLHKKKLCLPWDLIQTFLALLGGGQFAILMPIILMKVEQGLWVKF